MSKGAIGRKLLADDIQGHARPAVKSPLVKGARRLKRRSAIYVVYVCLHTPPDSNDSNWLRDDGACWQMCLHTGLEHLFYV
jgi:hypothetical protein